VEPEMLLLRQILSSLPMPNIAVLMDRYFVTDFTKILASYHKDNGRPVITKIHDSQVHQKIGARILKSVPFPRIRSCNLLNVRSEFVRQFLIKLLHFIQNIEILILPKLENLHCMQPLVQNCQIVRSCWLNYSTYYAVITMLSSPQKIPYV
jgi:hypothetical protein